MALNRAEELSVMISIPKFVGAVLFVESLKTVCVKARFT
jgi:hypothetical protein